MWLFVGLTYVGLVVLRRTVLQAHLDSAAIVAIWPASAILSAGLLTMPRAQRPKCLAVCVLGGLCVSLAYGNPVRSALGIAEGWMVAALASLFCGPKPNFSQGKTLFVFLVAAVAPTTLLSSLNLFVMSNLIGLTISPDQAIGWFFGHALGAALFVPALTVLIDQRRFLTLRRSRLELGLALAALTLLTAALFFAGSPALWFVLLPALMLLAFRHGPLGSASGAVIVAVLALFRIYATPGKPLGADETQAIQFFVAVLFLTTLPAAGAVAAHARMRSLLDRRTRAARDARHRADSASTAKGEFLANMSHEIRTPLNGVIGLADALSRTDLTDQQRELLGMILGSGKALTGLLSDALDLARADANSLSLAPEAFDVRQTVREAAYLFETIAKEKGLEFRVDFDVDAPGAAVGDALRIKQIVSNLISNAVKFTAQGSVTVEISMKRRGAGGRFKAVVRDTGPGFDEAVKARLFHRFEQGDSSVTRRYGGAGLGLAISQRLAGMMSGSLECEGAPGVGAVFTFEAPLPFATAAIESKAVAAAGTVESDRPLSILVAEDNPVNQKVVVAMLGALAELAIVADGQAAVEAWRAQAFDVILMDTHMPVMDGHTAIRAIRTEEATTGRARVPIISLTADAMPQQVQASLAAGADLHLAKPITAEGLIGALRTVLEGGAETGAAHVA